MSEGRCERHDLRIAPTSLTQHARLPSRQQSEPWGVPGRLTWGQLLTGVRGPLAISALVCTHPCPFQVCSVFQRAKTPPSLPSELP